MGGANSGESVQLTVLPVKWAGQTVKGQLLWRLLKRERERHGSATILCKRQQDSAHIVLACTVAAARARATSLVERLNMIAIEVVVGEGGRYVGR